MKGHASTWIEGDGTVRTVFRTMALYAYSSEEKAKRQLMKVMVPKNNQSGPYTLQFAIDRRKKEIQWISLYLPLLVLVIVGVLLVAAGLFSRNPRNLYLSLGTVIFLGFFFRVTWFTLYLDACRFLFKAGDALWKEGLGKGSPDTSKFSECPGIDAVEVCEAMDRLTADTPELPQRVQQLPIQGIHCQAEKSENHQGDDPDPEELSSINHSPVKGAISIYLLDELIKRECGRPNIHGGDIHKSTKYYSYISGCRPKNIINKARCYLNRQSMNLSTPNARTTHRKYTEILLEYYDAIEDDRLYKQAEDLQAFIEKSAEGKKK
jgi:hypothetical protein